MLIHKLESRQTVNKCFTFYIFIFRKENNLWCIFTCI